MSITQVSFGINSKIPSIMITLTACIVKTNEDHLVSIQLVGTSVILLVPSLVGLRRLPHIGKGIR